MQVKIHSLENIRVQSETYQEVWYRVDGLAGVCNCKGYKGWKYCKHRRRAQEALKEAGIDHQIPMDEEVEKRAEEMSEPPKMPDQLPKLYTSRFLATDVLMSGAVEPVRVSMFPPRMDLPYEIDQTVFELRPKKEILGPWNEYSPGYFGLLEKTGLARIASRLAQISVDCEEKPLALLCYEDLTKAHKCHRLLFGVWWEEETGDSVYELTNDGELLHPLEIHKQIMPIRRKK